ncbi:DNA methyltransferase [Candidatus Altiarchaeota archaeon]
MDFLLRFSGEHEKLPRAELVGVLDGECLKFEIGRIFKEKRMILIDVDCKEYSFLKRLAYTREAYVVLGTGQKLEVLAEKAIEALAPEETFRVNAPSLILERRLGALIAIKGFRVNLEKPDKIFYILEEKGSFILGQPVETGEEFEARKPQNRPFFHPTSMHPKLARILVNLARIKPGDLVLDPFVGTGGILIEAGLMGLNTKGWDVREDMIQGCIQNLKHYDLEGAVERMDAVSFQDKNEFVDAVVTDPPYGRGSFSSKKNPFTLYNDFLSRVGSWLKKNGFLVAVFPKEYKPSPANLNFCQTFDVYIHKSLTRKIWVFQKK